MDGYSLHSSWRNEIANQTLPGNLQKKEIEICCFICTHCEMNLFVVTTEQEIAGWHCVIAAAFCRINESRRTKNLAVNILSSLKGIELWLHSFTIHSDVYYVSDWLSALQYEQWERAQLPFTFVDRLESAVRTPQNKKNLDECGIFFVLINLRSAINWWLGNLVSVTSNQLHIVQVSAVTFACLHQTLTLSCQFLVSDRKRKQNNFQYRARTIQL